MKALDAAIAPAREHNVSAEDLARVREAAKAVASEKSSLSKEMEPAIANPAARKLIQWLRLRSGAEDPAEIAAFLAANPEWPERTGLTRLMEDGLFKRPPPPKTILAIFAKAQPRTAAGHIALASAHLAMGDKDRARAIAAEAWRAEEIPAALEPVFIERFGGVLTAADHASRIDALLAGEPHWAAERKTRAAGARRVIALLAPDEKTAAEARVTAFLAAGGIKAGEPKPAPPPAKSAKGTKQAKKKGVAAKPALETQAIDTILGDPDGAWKKRRGRAYDMLKANKPKEAYDLVRDIGPLSVNPLKEQTFMAGWIAFRLLKDRDAAEAHFAAMRKAADGPLSRAKAHYWLGRVAETKGDTAKANEHYLNAAREQDTFHGQLARQKLAPGPQGIEITPPAAPAAAEITRFNSHDAILAAVVAHKAGLDVSIPRAFLFHLPSVMDTEAGTGMIAHLAEAMGDTQTSVRIAKSAVARGHNLIYYGYPVHPFPAYTPLRDPPETAFLLGVARQESEFNTLTVSTAGAKGLLQVMTITAKHVCRDYKIKCEIDRLLKDKPYNTMLASAYIADRMGEFSGSYVLGLAGYNAGPGRARQWIKAFGDPRDPKVDPIDWIERIPFQETREYVAKVLSNIQVYRARLGERETALRLEDDLKRGRFGSAKLAEPKAAAAGE